MYIVDDNAFINVIRKLFGFSGSIYQEPRIRSNVIKRIVVIAFCSAILSNILFYTKVIEGSTDINFANLFEIVGDNRLEYYYIIIKILIFSPIWETMVLCSFLYIMSNVLYLPNFISVIVAIIAAAIHIRIDQIGYIMVFFGFIIMNYLYFCVDYGQNRFSVAFIYIVIYHFMHNLLCVVIGVFAGIVL